MVKRLVPVLTFLSLAVLGADPALAGKKTFILDPYAARTQNGTGRIIGTAGDAGIGVPQGGDFAFGWVIPKPYKKDSAIRVILQWHVADPNCTIELLPEFLDRSRPGHAAATAPSNGGFVPEDASIVLLAGTVANQGNVKVYTISPGQGFDQISGDALLFSFVRGSGVNDTCVSDLVVTAATVEYLTP